MQEPFSFFIFLSTLSLLINVYSSGDDEPGVGQSRVVQMYLDDIEEELDSEEELFRRKTLVEKVIRRLVTHVIHSLFSSFQYSILTSLSETEGMYTTYRSVGTV